MRAVPVTLIIVGGLLVLAPVVFGCLHEANVVQLLLGKYELADNLQRTPSAVYTFGCWFIGTAMIVVSVVLTVWSYQRAPAATRGEGSPGAA